MNYDNALLHKVFSSCQFRLNSCTFSRESVITAVLEFLNGCTRKEGHTVGMVFHTGSVLYDAAAVFYAAITSILFNDISSGDIVNNLNPGDMVLYGNKRCLFKEVTDNYEADPGKRYAVLSGDSDGATMYVGEGSWNRIAPYKGRSTRRDGRGVRKINSTRNEFFEKVLGYKKSSVPSVIDTSAVIVMRRDRADYLINGLTLMFGDKEINLRELVPVSYYTDSEEPFFYGGNSGKNEAVLQICGYISVARQLLSETDGNRKTTILVTGEDVIRRSITELPALLKRRSVDNVFVMTDINDRNVEALLEMYEESEVFACTKKRIRKGGAVSPHSDNELTRELSSQISAVADYECKPVSLSGSIEWEEYKRFRRSISTIRHSDWDNSDRDMFIILACAAMKLYMSAPFRLSVLEKMISDGIISNVQSPTARLSELKRLAGSFPEYLKGQADWCVSLLDKMNEMLCEKSEKEEYLLRIAKETGYDRLAVIVPKAYYATVITEMGLFSTSSRKKTPDIYTANRFPKEQVYDLIIAVSDYIGTRFNPYQCSLAKSTRVLLYEYEDRFFVHNMKNAKRTENRLNALSDHIDSSSPDYIDYYDNEGTDMEEVVEIREISQEVDDFIDGINDRIAFGRIEGYGGKANTVAEVIALGVFESGERAFFTRRYKAYVYDEAQGIIEEKSVEELEEGDSLVFTKYDNETRDIVDDVLGNLVMRHQVDSGIDAEYKKSKKWKDTLFNYMNQMELSAEYIANEMIKNGVSVQSSTIKIWLDPDSRTVGPRNPDSIRQIAILVGDREMETHYREYYDACANIRRIRRNILKEIGNAIRMKLGHKVPKQNTMAAYVYDKIDDLAFIVRLEKVMRTCREVPVNMINRPIVFED